MTFLEAINKIHKAVNELKIKNADGEILLDEFGLARVGANMSDRYDQVLEDLEVGKIDVDGYYQEMMALILSYREFEAAAKLENIIQEQSAKQNESTLAKQDSLSLDAQGK